MEKFNKLKLNEKLCVAAFLIEKLETGFEYKDKYFEAKDFNFTNCFEISRSLYIFSNLIVNKDSYNITPNIKKLIKNKKVLVYLSYFDNHEVNDKIDITSQIFEYLSNDKELKKLGFKDNINENYRFIDLSKDLLLIKN